jgi:hypothetical protein
MSPQNADLRGFRQLSSLYYRGAIRASPHDGVAYGLQGALPVGATLEESDHAAAATRALHCER